MGHHIDSEGRFQSDKFPDLPPDTFLLSLKDPEARAAISTYVTICKDRELATDLIQRMRVLRFGAHDEIHKVAKAFDALVHDRDG